MKNKLIKAITVSVLLVLVGTTTAFAVSSPNSKGTTASNLKSNGVIAISDEDSGETALIDSSDLYNLADSIDSEAEARTNADTQLKTDIEQTIQPKLDELQTEIGDLDLLETTNKTDLVSALNDCFISVANGKITIASALATKGKAIANDASFEEIANAIKTLEQKIEVKNYQTGTMSITAHFCTTNSDPLVKFTDTSSKSAWQQYEEYLNSHPASTTSTSSGCFTIKHMVYEKTGTRQVPEYSSRTATHCDENWTDCIPRAGGGIDHCETFLGYNCFDYTESYISGYHSEDVYGYVQHGWESCGKGYKNGEILLVEIKLNEK